MVKTGRMKVYLGVQDYRILAQFEEVPRNTMIIGVRMKRHEHI